MKSTSVLLTVGLVGYILGLADSVRVRPGKGGKQLVLGQSRANVLWADWWIKRIIGRHVRGKDLYEGDLDASYNDEDHDTRNWLYVHVHEENRIAGYGVRLCHKLMITADYLAEQMRDTNVTHVLQDDLPRIWKENEKFLPATQRFFMSRRGIYEFNIKNTGLSLVQFNSTYKSGLKINPNDVWKPINIQSRSAKLAEDHKYWDLFYFYVYRRHDDPRQLQLMRHYARLIGCPELYDPDDPRKEVTTSRCKFKMAMLGSEDVEFCTDDVGTAIFWPGNNLVYVAIEPVNGTCDKFFWAGKYWITRDRIATYARSGYEAGVI